MVYWGLTAGFALLTIHGLWSGKASIAYFGTADRRTNPRAYWFATAIHVVVLCALVGAGVRHPDPDLLLSKT
jgi:hypothetical protein